MAMTPRSLYVKHECELQGIDLEDESLDGLDGLFGMHMAFDPESSLRLSYVLDNFGWAIVQREHPDEYARMNENDAAEDDCVNLADNYATQLKIHLAHRWLAKE